MRTLPLVLVLTLAACEGGKDPSPDDSTADDSAINDDSTADDSSADDSAINDDSTADDSTADDSSADDSSADDSTADDSSADDSSAPTDEDGDGFTVEEDCDDGDAAVFPGAEERCDERDNNCDGDVDEGVTTEFYADLDADDWGDEAVTEAACEAPEGYVSRAGDCDDGDARFNPGAEELDCEDPNDYNCDGSTGYADGDGDGVPACADCDDARAESYPGAAETCDERDNNCDGDIDEGVTTTYFGDADADGYGDASSPVLACELPTGAAVLSTDCDDADGAVNPGAAERCNLVDDDCDGLADDDDPSVDTTGEPTSYADADTDGYGDSATATVTCDVAPGRALVGGDCDDGDAAVNPAAVEVCDGLDNDCDGGLDDDDASVDLTTGRSWYSDDDLDGYGDPGALTRACEAPAGAVSDNTDCDDTSAAVRPGATEVCNGLDDDCDGLGDDDDAGLDLGTATRRWADADADGYGDPFTAALTCEAPAGFVENDDDCDDGDTGVSPAATEVCDGLDNNCDALADDLAADLDLSTASTWFTDADGDLHGDASAPLLACLLPAGAAASDDDCDDGDAAVNPDATEICGGGDEDCDGLSDDDDASVDLTTATVSYRDADLDGYGDARSSSRACLVPSGYVLVSTDCDDAEPNRNPGEIEVCNGVDDDCDALNDDDDDSLDLSTATTRYADLDGDGFGDPLSPDTSCVAPAGTTLDDQDCDDSAKAVNPTATESCDQIDNDCDGVVDGLTLYSETFDGGVPSGMQINGNSYWTRFGSDGVLVGSFPTNWQVGSALLRSTVPATNLTISFTFSIGSGSGADGMALVLLDPSTATTAVGSTGGGLGAYGLKGLVLEFDTFNNGTGDPSSNHIALADAATGSTYVSSSSIPTMNNAGEFDAELVKTGNTFTFSLDGSVVFTHTLSTAFPWSTTRVGLTAATGGLNNYHITDDLEIVCH